MWQHIQSVQLKSGPYFNVSNLFTKIYNMLYYTTKLYLQYVLEMMSIHFNALIDTFHHVPRRLRFLSKREPVSRNFLIIFAIALFTGACILNFSKKLCLQWA